MKKIMALDQGEYLGGAELFFSDLLVRASNDFEIHLITGQNSTYHERYKNSSVILHPMELPSLKPIGLKSYKKYRQAQKLILNYIKKIQPDKIVSNTVRTHLLVSNLAKKKRIPLVWMAHDRTFSGVFMKWLKKCPQTLISCSKFVEDYYLQHLGQRENLNPQILYPFALEPGQMEPYQYLKKEKMIGMVGKFIPWKGQDLFIHMAHKIHLLYPNYRFELIGSPYQNNPESLTFYKDCEVLIEKLGLNDVLEIKTSVSDIFAEMSRWEILVHASCEPESLGRVILEGMASGCVVIASHLGGPKEVIQNNQTGLLVPPTVDDFFNAVQWRLQHAKESAEMAELARKEVGQNYVWPKVMQQFKMVLEAA